MIIICKNIIYFSIMFQFIEAAGLIVHNCYNL